MPDAGAGSRLRSWAYALRTTNPPADGPTDTVTRWLVVTRAAVLPMTLVSGLVAGCWRSASLAWIGAGSSCGGNHMRRTSPTTL
ncbi:hypothetical protein RN09_0579 [Mycobacterium tuberculosis variant africanum]|nr:hypothetical protein RN09_0579 [Mycobacterium tuberculosis variant africanum]